MIIGITGLIGSGKDTIASHLVEQHGYERYSWAMPLKDITATLFGWDRDMLEGTTPEQREKREQIDLWWDNKLGKKDQVSPRWILQFIGTEVMRNTLHPDIWVLAGIKRIAGKQNVVIPDTRFPNEIKAIREIGGVIWNVQRGPLPVWYNDLMEWHKLFENDYLEKDVNRDMKKYHPSVHPSEYSWVGTKFDAVFHNNETVLRLKQGVDSVIGN
jgi:hypothetical protein